MQTTARLKIPGPCAPRRPGGAMHFSSATPTGGARARRARTLPATSATASPARLSHTGPGAGVHPAPPGKGPGKWSWRTLAFDPLGNPGRPAAHPPGRPAPRGFLFKDKPPSRTPAKTRALPRHSVCLSPREQGQPHLPATPQEKLSPPSQSRGRSVHLPRPTPHARVTRGADPRNVS